MKVVIDIETNSLVKPSKIWVVVCKDIDTGEYHVFREPTSDDTERKRLVEFSQRVEQFIGHFILAYDLVVLNDLIPGWTYSVPSVKDTLLISKLVDFSREGGHSIEQYGEEFNLPKIEFNDFKQYSPEMEEYCKRDVDISHLIYLKYLKYILKYPYVVSTASTFQHKVINSLHTKGFYINTTVALKLLDKVHKELEVLNENLKVSFPLRSKLIREVIPRGTKHGTIARNSIPKVLGTDYTQFSIGSPFSLFKYEEFNPDSHKQRVDILWEAGWKPEDKTETHKDTERELKRLRYSKNKDKEVDIRIQSCILKMEGLSKYGWKVNENNLSTLPEKAPSSAKALAKRLTYEARRRTLTEWLSLVNPETGRIHGSFQFPGAWTGRMAHQNPNTANIPNEFDTATGKKKVLGKELRALWQAPKGRLLVGVDADAIQLRIFAHYVNDPKLINAIVNGKKSDRTDPHSYNMGVLGDVCKTRQAAKRFLYAVFLGAGVDKLAFILSCPVDGAAEALARLLKAYPGFEYLKQEVIPADARRGYFIGLNGQPVRIPGDSVGERRHLCMSGYLQHGEAVVMDLATLEWIDKLPDYNSFLVNFVHDEWQTETPNRMDIALDVARMQADSLRVVGDRLGLRIPLLGSYYNEDLQDYTIGTTWAVTH